MVPWAPVFVPLVVALPLPLFNDPDGNIWLVQEVTTRLPGRV